MLGSAMVTTRLSSETMKTATEVTMIVQIIVRRLTVADDGTGTPLPLTSE